MKTLNMLSTALLVSCLMVSSSMAQSGTHVTSKKSKVKEQKNIIIKMYSTSASHAYIGTVTVTAYDNGLLFTPKLHGLVASTAHGFHIHQNPSCANEGKAAGGHWDPNKTKSHQGPYGDGHLGDLPVLYVDNAGDANSPVFAPRIHNLSEIKGHSLMIHAGSDNYSDHPEALGGGGARMWCGVIH
ncbi:superoxide dismutase family protein [Cysteiniphilum halobium]|uniref:superoxide dismutase family protein n=1 Tax=Cysteiniphilum halobium TaxID=2219059 RepID=UPI000E64AAA3|nr:superoxide dismutase family protein [Cysteiniphilum halobium]